MQLDRCKRLTAIWTRDLNSKQLAGRPRIIASIREAMQANYSVENLRLINLIEKRNLGTIVRAVTRAIWSTLCGAQLPLQCLLYADSRNHQDLLRRLEMDPPETLYCDGVRTYLFLKRMGNLRDRMRIVVDFDDLMSRRMEMSGTSGASLSFGYLYDKMPALLRSTLALGWISRFVARREGSALQRVEDSIGHWADAVTLLSSVEADILQRRYRKIGCKAEVHVIPPPMDVAKDPQSYHQFSRFIFIGSDALPQNRMAIQLILDLWQLNRPTAEIHIFGRMVSRWKSIPGVVFRDYAPSLEDVYAEGSVLFAPGVLRGGIKTKVAEAFAFGCAVVGNDVTFEGLLADNYPMLIVSKEELGNVIRCPSLYLKRMRQAAVVGQDYVKANLSRERFQENWDRVLG